MEKWSYVESDCFTLVAKVFCMEEHRGWMNHNTKLIMHRMSSSNRLMHRISLELRCEQCLKNYPTVYILFCVSGLDVLWISTVHINICLAPYSSFSTTKLGWPKSGIFACFSRARSSHRTHIQLEQPLNPPSQTG